MIVGIQSGGIGKVDMKSPAAGTDKDKTKGKESGMFADLMNLAYTKTDSPTQVQPVSQSGKTDDTGALQEKKPVSAPDVKPQKKTTGKADGKEEAQETWKVSLLSDKLKEVLGVDDETLQNMLEMAGVSLQDLLNPDSMKDFILQINGAEPVDLLIDESLNDFVEQLMQSLDEILSMTDTDAAGTGMQEILPADTDMADASQAQAPDLNVQKADEKTRAAAEPESEDGLLHGEEQTAGADAEVSFAVQPEHSGHADTSSDFLNQNTENVIANLNQAMAGVNEEILDGTQFDASVSQADIVRQVVDEIKLSISKDVTSMTLQLNPEQLGKVQIHVSTKNGIMQAQIIAENEAAKNAVESGISVLKEAFDNKDLKVDAIEVMVGTADYFAEQEGTDAQTDARQEKNGKSSIAVNLQGSLDDDISEDETLESEIMKAQGNQVNYMA